MKISIVYVHPCLDIAKYGPAARRWADSYMTNPPGESDHDLYVVLNGSNGVGPYHRKLFDPLPVQFLEHSNFGKDLGAFQMAAEIIPCDLIIFMGAHVNFHRAGWLDRMVRVFEEYGPALYGAWGFHQPRPHLRTTFFWCPPEIFRAYPYQISNQMRYPAEHGAESITLWAKSMGFEPLMVSWAQVLPMERWHNISREESLALDQHTQ